MSLYSFTLKQYQRSTKDLKHFFQTHFMHHQIFSLQGGNNIVCRHNVQRAKLSSVQSPLCLKMRRGRKHLHIGQTAFSPFSKRYIFRNLYMATFTLKKYVAQTQCYAVQTTQFNQGFFLYVLLDRTHYKRPQGYDSCQIILTTSLKEKYPLKLLTLFILNPQVLST